MAYAQYRRLAKMWVDYSEFIGKKFLGCCFCALLSANLIAVPSTLREQKERQSRVAFLTCIPTNRLQLFFGTPVNYIPCLPCCTKPVQCLLNALALGSKPWVQFPSQTDSNFFSFRLNSFAYRTSPIKFGTGLSTPEPVIVLFIPSHRHFSFSSIPPMLQGLINAITLSRSYLVHDRDGSD